MKEEAKDTPASLSAVESGLQTDPGVVESPLYVREDRTPSTGAPISDPNRLRDEPHSGKPSGTSEVFSEVEVVLTMTPMAC